MRPPRRSLFLSDKIDALPSADHAGKALNQKQASDDLDRRSGFSGDDYRLTSLVRPPVFLIPSHKLKQPTDCGAAVEDRLHDFLIDRFGAFTTTTLPHFVFWRSREQKAIPDECRQYGVSQSGKERIGPALKYPAKLAQEIREECLCVKDGQYACLVLPK